VLSVLQVLPTAAVERNAAATRAELLVMAEDLGLDNELLQDFIDGVDGDLQQVATMLTDQGAPSLATVRAQAKEQAAAAAAAAVESVRRSLDSSTSYTMKLATLTVSHVVRAMRCVHQDQAVSPDDAAVRDYLANVVLHPAAGPLKFSLEQSARVIDAFKSAGYEPSRSATSLGPVLWLSVVAFNVGAGCTIVAVG
jgi:hypothetical protein